MIKCRKLNLLFIIQICIEILPCPMHYVLIIGLENDSWKFPKA